MSPPLVDPGQRQISVKTGFLARQRPPGCSQIQGYRIWIGAALFSSVTPAKAGVQGDERALATLDPGFRQDDGKRAALSRSRVENL